jgi:hypothetical protein
VGVRAEGVRLGDGGSAKIGPTDTVILPKKMSDITIRKIRRIARKLYINNYIQKEPFWQALQRENLVKRQKILAL